MNTDPQDILERDENAMQADERVVPAIRFIADAPARGYAGQEK